MRNFHKYVLFPKFQSLDPQTIDILIPDTIDEIKASQENELLGEGKMTDVGPTDNHEQHLAVHAQAKDSWAKWIHIGWHEEALSQQRQQQMMQAQMQAQPQTPGNASGEPAQPQVGVANQKPLEAAASLRNETLQNIQQKQ
jgi:hypothetical protein